MAVAMWPLTLSLPPCQRRTLCPSSSSVARRRWLHPHRHALPFGRRPLKRPAGRLRLRFRHLACRFGRRYGHRYGRRRRRRRRHLSPRGSCSSEEPTTRPVARASRQARSTRPRLPPERAVAPWWPAFASGLSLVEVLYRVCFTHAHPQIRRYIIAWPGTWHRTTWRLLPTLPTLRRARRRLPSLL